MQALVLRRLLSSSSVHLDLALFQYSNGLYVKVILHLEFLSMPFDLLKPLEMGAPPVDLDHSLESENLLRPLLLKLLLLPLFFLKLGVNATPFPLRSPLLLLLVRSVRAGVERHNEFLAASFYKAIMNKYLPVCQLVVRSARRDPFFRRCTCARRP